MLRAEKVSVGGLEMLVISLRHTGFYLSSLMFFFEYGGRMYRGYASCTITGEDGRDYYFITSYNEYSDDIREVAYIGGSRRGCRFTFIKDDAVYVLKTRAVTLCSLTEYADIHGALFTDDDFVRERVVKYAFYLVGSLPYMGAVERGIAEEFIDYVASLYPKETVKLKARFSLYTL